MRARGCLSFNSDQIWVFLTPMYACVCGICEKCLSKNWIKWVLGFATCAYSCGICEKSMSKIGLNVGFSYSQVCVYGICKKSLSKIGLNVGFWFCMRVRMCGMLQEMFIF